MKQGWEIKKLGEVFKLEYGKPLAIEERNENGLYPVYGANGVISNSDKYYYDKPSIIVGRKGTAGALTLSGHKFHPLDVTYYTTFDDNKYLLKYIYYLLLDLNLPSFAKGVKPGINRNDVYCIKAGFPFLDEQERIVGILDSAFVKIEALRANAQQNFQNTKDLFQASLKQELSPKQGWKTQKLDAIADITSSKRIYKNEYVREGIPFYRTKEIKELANGHEISLELFISTERYQEIKNKFGVPQIGDILISAVGTIGEILVIRDESEFYFKDGNIIWIKDVSKATSSFLSYNLKSIIEQLKSITIGAAYSALTIEKFKEMEVSFPDSKIEQQAIVEKLDALNEHCRAMEENYRQTIAHCNALKQALLTKAFNGEL